MATGRKPDYAGPTWVAPLFKWLGIVAVSAYILGFTYEVEWESNA